MKPALQPHTVPQPQMVVAVPSLTPTYGLLCLQPVDGYEAGTIRPVYGGYHDPETNEERYYANGTTSKYMRLAAEEESYENEFLPGALPDYIDEINPRDYKGCYQLVITDAKVIPVPVPVKAPKKECRVITHPATKAAASKQEAAKTGAKVLPLFPDYNPKQLSA